MLTDVGEAIVKSGCDGIEFNPMQVSVCFLILLCSLEPMEPSVVEERPACSKLRVNRQRDVDPMYDNSHLPHTYL